MKKLSLTLFALTCLMLPTQSWAREGSSVGLLGVGDFFLTDANPQLKIGPGGGIAIDFRFNQRWALESDFYFSIHDGKGANAGDNSQYLLGVPNVNLKFYFMSEEANIEPYALAGIGLYFLTEGSRSDNTGGVGMGAQIGLGVDFYVAERLSVGLSAQFRSIGLIQGNSNSSALMDFGMTGNVMYHF